AVVDVASDTRDRRIHAPAADVRHGCGRPDHGFHQRDVGLPRTLQRRAEHVDVSRRADLLPELWPRLSLRHETLVRAGLREMINSLRELRAERGWSQGDLADALGVSRQSINALETGKFDPSLPL